MRAPVMPALLLAAALASGAAACGPKQEIPGTLRNWAPPPSPPAEMRMTLFSGARIQAKESDALRGGDPEKILTMPVVMAFVKHPKGNVLIDTAFGRNHARHIEEFPANLYQKVMEPEFDPEKDTAVAQLAALGIGSGEVDVILPTHMHWDHIGGLGDFPQARLILPRAEWDAAHRSELTLAARGYTDSMYEDLTPETFLVEWPNRPYGTFERSVDLYGDGSIVLLDASGHTPGHMAVLVTVPTGERFLFTGDATWLRRGVRERKHKGRKTRLLDNSRRGVMPTIERIARLEELAPEVKIVPAHDPEVWSELKHAPYWYGEPAAATEAEPAPQPTEKP